VQIWPMTAPALEPGCIAPAAQGGLVVALRDGVYRAPTWGGPLHKIAAFDFDTATTRFNDGKCDTHGRFWAGTMYEPRDAKRGHLYCVDATQSGPIVVKTQLGGVLTANGVNWSPDNRTLYWNDTPSHLMRAWDFDATHNTLSHERVFKQFPTKPNGWQPGDSGYLGRPDGTAVDVMGNLYVAMYEGGRVLKLSPQGDILADWPTPMQCPTMPCFGGRDLKTLYLTSASHGRSPDELSRMPWSGAVLAMPVDVPGLAVNLYVGP
jgi:sugar lactone lactonase YvrE